MNVVFTQLYQDVCEVWFGIQKADVQITLAAPDAQQLYQIEDLELGLCTKRFQRNGSDALLLVCTRKGSDTQSVDLAFWILPDLIVGVTGLEPLVLLQLLATRFGLSLRVGNQVNKFVFRETITINGPMEANQIVQIINPENHSFVQSIFIKVSEDSRGHHIHLALAYCIDTDEYIKWLLQTQSVGEVSFQIAPQLRRLVTPLSLISSSGALTFSMNYNQLQEGRAGKLFRVECADYYLEVGFTPTHFYISRSGETLERDLRLSSGPTGEACFFAMWDPNRLHIVLLDEAYNQLLLGGKEPLQAVRECTSIINTKVVLPPASLINAVRRLVVLPIMQYQSISDLCQQVAAALDTIPDKIITTNMYSAFWDNQYESRKLKLRTPKREPEIHPTIHGLLFDIAIAKNLEVSPEYQIAGGRLDFLFTGNLTTGETVSVCVEFKHAHSADLIHGLIEQLPAYMRAKGCDFGIYCVMYFKGPDFQQPVQYDDHSLHLKLVATRNAAGLDNIKICIFDISRQKSPSRT
ncbi:MAG: hypothetical protein AABZ15_01795 [Nitrospirota bacterium]